MRLSVWLKGVAFDLMFVKRLMVICLMTVIAPGIFAETAKNSPDTADLSTVIRAVQSALNTYQNTRNSDALPPLKSAEFDFKTTVATSVTGKLTLFIFTIGGSHEQDQVSDVTFLYAVPAAKPAAIRSRNKGQVSLQDQLVLTIRSAAEAVRNAESFGSLPLSTLTVNVQYCVKNDVNGGGGATTPFVTINVGGDKNRNTVQSVKLVFGK